MTPVKKILILSANPRGTAHLRLDQEVSEIEEGLRRSKLREQFVIHSKWATNLTILRRAMLDYEPHIVHFCGHGEENGLIVEDESGNPVIVKPDALSGLFELFSGKIECVFLNACYSAIQVNAISKFVPYVIGMSTGIQDKSAISFAVGFYDALGAGKSIDEAYKFGRNAIQLNNIPEYLAPILKKQPISFTHHHKTIAILCPLFGASRIYYTELLSAIMGQARQKGYELLIVPVENTAYKRPLVSHFSQVSSVDGIILITCQVEGSNWLIECKSRNIPVVLLHDNIPEEKARQYTVVSHIQPSLDSLSTLVQHLIDTHNCKNISVVTVNPDNHTIRSEKIAIIENVLRDRNLSFNRDHNMYCIAEYSQEQGVFVVDRIMENNPSTDAIICLSDVTALGVIQCLKESGNHKNIRVTGFDNVDVALQNDITTIDQQLKQTGEEAVKALYKAFQSNFIIEFKKIFKIPTTFVQRGSCCFSEEEK